MFYFIMICFQLLFSFFLFLYFNRKLMRVIEGEKLKKELSDLIIDFNQYAERNLTLFEDRKKQIDSQLAAVEQRLARAREKLFFEQQPAKALLKKKTAAAVKKQTRTAKKHSGVPVKNGLALKEYFENKTGLNYEKLPLPQKIKYLREQQHSDKMIARKLKLSLAEIQMISSNLA